MNKRRIKGILCVLAILVLIFGMFPSIGNVAKASNDSFSLGKFDYETEKFINASGSGDTKYKSLLIAYGNNLADGESLVLPTVDGFVKSTNASTNYSTVINMSAGKTPEEIANYVKQIEFRNSPGGQTIQVVISEEVINNKTFYYAGNQHYYQYVKYANIGTSSSNPGNHSWVDAYNEAKNLSYGGRKGYLATVTSFEEDLFIYNASSSIGWLGGTVLTHGGEEGALYYSSFDKNSGQNTWYWACGPERGQTFFVGKGSGAYQSNDNAGYYFNWANGEPNKSKSGAESCLTSLRTGIGYGARKAGSSIQSSWNDAPENSQSYHATYGVKGYFVEYGDQTVGDSGLNSGSSIVVNAVISRPTILQSGSQVLKYIGKENEPNINIKDGNKTLENGIDYDIEYVGVDSTTYGPSNTAPTELGNYKAIIKYKGDYTDFSNVEIEFSIIINEVANPEIILESSKIVYTGNEIKPNIVVKDDNGNIIPESEYEVRYENNIEIGEAKVIITSKDNEKYIMNVEKTFRILPIPGETKAIDTNDSNACNAKIDENDLSSKIELSEQELNAKENGKDIEIYLEIEDISDSISDEDKKLIEEKLGKNTVGIYLDINLFKKITGEEATKINETIEPITITFEIPEKLINTNSKINRKFKILKIHDGVVSEVDVKVNGRTATFTTSQFSNYTLVYEDVEKSVNPKTGDNIAIYGTLFIISLLGIGTLIKYIQRKK